MCSGKVYFDLLEYQQKNNRTDIALLRLEQLYPFPMTQLNAQIEKYKGAELMWVQEEPRNMGAWFYIWNLLGTKINKKVSRKSSASPATGFAKIHAKEQQEIVEQAFAD